MKVIASPMEGIKLIEPRVIGDARGYFLEAYNSRDFAALGIEAQFVQDNHSHSPRAVLRGLHYQLRHPQGKLACVVSGEVFDVAVDMRRHSASFGHWYGVRLSAENHRMLWVDGGFAHGMLVLSESADFIYKTTDFYVPEDEHCLRWDDPQVGIEWPLTGSPRLSDKDRNGTSFTTAAYVT